MTHLIEKHISKSWVESKTSDKFSLSVNGCIYFNNRRTEVVDWPDILPLIASGNNELASRLNGFYSWILEEPGCLFASVDRIRSYPLFYGVLNNRLYISDEAEWVRDKIGDKVIDENVKLEFKFSGFVSGNRTLFRNVYQLQAGEYLKACVNNGEINIEINRYYKYDYDRCNVLTEQKILAHAKENLLNVFRRLVSYSDGRTIIVPLSGGYDSRVIVMMLKICGYEDVITFTYGKRDNEEARISQYVATQLGYKWYFVDYSDQVWQNCYNSIEFAEFFSSAGNFTSAPHIQDFPAVMELKNILNIDEDHGYVFVPGISADLNTGAFINKYPEIYNKKIDESALVDHILDYSYTLFSSKTMTRDDEKMLKNKISTIIENSPYNISDPGYSFELWVGLEKVAKYISNSVRAYEKIGCSWWLPFWDAEFYDFWAKVPDRYRINQKLYKSLIEDLANDLRIFKDVNPLVRPGLFSDELNAPRVKNKNGHLSVKQIMNKSIRSAAKKIIPKIIKKKLREKMNQYQYKAHFLNWFSMYNDVHVRANLKDGAQNIVSFVVMDYLNRIEKSR